MKIVDRYILLNFLKIFVLSYLTFVALFVIFDLFGCFSEFLETDASLFRVARSLFEYYFLNSFKFIDIIFPLLIAAAATTATTLMARQNELIALSAMGVAPARSIIPILIGAALISCAFTGVREFFLPTRLIEMNFSPREFVERPDEIEVNCAFDDPLKISIDGDRIIRSQGLLVEPRITLGRNLNKYGSRIVGKTGVYLDADGERPAGWLLRGVSKPTELTEKLSVADESISQSPILFFPGDASWLQDDEAFVATSVGLKETSIGENARFYGSTRELNESLKLAKTRRDATKLAIRVHSRMLRPFADLLPLLLGLPFVFFRNDRNAFGTLGVGLLLAGAYIGTQYASVYFGEKLECAAIGVWTPALIFVPIAANTFGKLTYRGTTKKSAT